MNEIKERLSRDFTDKILQEVNIDIKNLSRKEKIEAWAGDVKNNSDWKEIQNRYINSIYAETNLYIKNLCKTKEGQLRVVKLLDIKNIKGYPKLLNKLQ